MSIRYAVLLVLFASSLVAARLIPGHAEEPEAFFPAGNYPKMLSEWSFFEGKPTELVKAEGALPYELHTPLFSDYAWKDRFIRLPEGGKIQYHDSLVMDFPEGTTIVKTFYYPHDFRKPDQGRTLMETRVLLKGQKGWVTLPYSWNEEQTDARLKLLGDKKPASWVHSNGKKMKLEYDVPNVNECKGCHKYGKKLQPIGPTARQLGQVPDGNGGYKDLLQVWADAGVLEGYTGSSAREQVPVWDRPETGSVEDRARIWLDVNCGHCHRKDGPGNTSGLYLDWYTTTPTQWGVHKPTVAAGRAARGRLYGIEPGKPDESILVYRLESTDPGVRMPEVGRNLVDKEGLELVRKWIKGMDPEAYK